MGGMETDTTLILTSEAANIIGVAADTIRHWERTGRLPALKTSHGVRLFNIQDVQRLACQREARRRALTPSGDTARGRL